MQAAHNVELGDRFAPSFARPLPHFFERHRVGARVLGLFSERAQPATGHANVGRVDVPVYVVISAVAVHPLAHDVGQIAYRENIGGAVQRGAVVEVETFSRLDF